MPVSNDPYDTNRKFGIDHPNVFIPFQTKGLMIYFESYVPADEELDNCVHICLTGQEEWDPNNVKMDIHRPQSLDVHWVNIIPYEHEYETALILGIISTSFVEKQVAS